MKKTTISWIFVLLLVIIYGCASQNNQLDDDKQITSDVISCSENDDCLISTVGTHPDLSGSVFSGYRGYGANSERIDAVCLSKQYFNENADKYNFKTYSADFQIWTGSESNCGCKQGKCEEILYGAPPSPR